MRHDTPRLTDQQVLLHARSRLQAHLPLHADGYRCTTHDLLQVLLGVAVNQGTIEAICADLLDAPDPSTIRRYLNAQLRLEELPDLEQRVNAALAAEIPQYVWGYARDVAIDFHDRPYYGTAPQATGLWLRGSAKAGTTRFYRVATAYVMLHDVRVTLALHFVRPTDATVTVLDTLLWRLDHVAIHPKRLFLDKGFAGSPVIAYLTKRQQAALIACPIRGTRGGTRALCRGRHSYRTPYTFRGPDHPPVTANLAVCRVFTTAKRTQRHTRQAAWLLFILIHLDLTPQQARRQYRRRFGIESSYRCAGQVRGWTTSRNVAYRFVVIALSFVLLNVWLQLRWQFTQVPRRGRRWLDTRRFPLTRFATFLRRALERHYGYVHVIVAPAVPRL